MQLDRRAALAAAVAAASFVSENGAHAQQGPGGNSAEERLRQLGIALPNVPAPVANYVPAVRVGNLVFLAGTGPSESGRAIRQGSSALI